MDLFPQEVQDMILGQANDMTRSILFMSYHCLRNQLESDSNLDLINALQMCLEAKMYRQLYWFYLCFPSHTDWLYLASLRCKDAVVLHRFIDKWLLLSILRKDSKHPRTEEFITNLMCNGTEHQVKSILQKGFVISEIPNSINPSLLDMLSDMNDMKDSDVYQKQFVALAFVCGCQRYIEKFENKDGKLRDLIRLCHILEAAERNELNSIIWYHKVCRCKPSNYNKCILPTTLLYRMSTKSDPKIYNWLTKYTNCALTHRGYTSSAGRLHFGFHRRYDI